MPNIQGKYTLTEVSVLLGVSPSWINKIQKRTGIAKKNGGKGVRVYFDEVELAELRRVKFYRHLDFTLDEIKKIFITEKKMIKMRGYADYGSTVIDESRFLIHPFGIVFYDVEDEEGKTVNTLTEEQEREYDILKNFVLSVSKEAVKRVAKLEEECKGFKNLVRINTQLRSE